MTLYGALYAAVAGLGSQSNELGVISNNIANVNTVGYKQASATFESLITNSGDVAAYTPGGVLGSSQSLVTTQGLLQTTTSPTDIAISGGGFFVTNTAADQSGQVLYTRAGSFTANAAGNFVNTAGLFLQAWPLDRSGNLPGVPGNLNTTSSANLSSLNTVNVQNLAGTASATNSVSVGANLNSSQTVLAGANGVATMDALDVANYPLTGANLIVPSAVDSLVRGDVINVSTGSNSSGFNYTYGGLTKGRNVTTAANGDLAQALKPQTETLPANAGFDTINNNLTITVHSPGHGLVTGDVISFKTFPQATLSNVPASVFLSNQFSVTFVDANTYTITLPTGTTPPNATTGAATGNAVVTTRPYAGDILDAQNASQPLLGVTGTTNIDPNALSFTIATPATGTVKFTYTATAPNATIGQFNTISNLADAINATGGLTARVVNNQLWIGATDATQAVTFANTQSTSSGGGALPVLAGVDWVRELGFSNISAQANRFSSLNSLAALVNTSAGISAAVENPLATADLKISVIDPTDTITFKDVAGNTGSLLSQLGLATSQNGTSPAVLKTKGPTGPAYNPQVSANNMASGAIAPQFSRPVSVFDGLGTSHTLNIAFSKLQNNTWAVEIYAQPATDISSSSGTLVNGQVATGLIKFNGDGSLQNVSASLTSALTVNWTNGSTSSKISFDWGTQGLPFGTPGATQIGKTDGMSQFDSGYNVSFVNQNGAPVGQLTAIAIDSDGYITASYNNGETQKLYKIPLASFTDPNELTAASGNAYAQSNGSGIVNLKQAGQSGVGTISAGALESSNVELASELTNMIVAQRAYQANSKVIQTADQLLSALDQIIQ